MTAAVGVLTRKVAAKAAPPDAGPVVRRAMRQAADRLLGLDAQVSGIEITTATPEQLLAPCGEQSLLLTLEREGAVVGAVSMEQPVWSALVALQTIGRIGRSDARAPSGADAAMAEPLINSFIQALLAQDVPDELAAWMPGLVVGKRLRSRRIVELTMPPHPIGALTVNMALEDEETAALCLFATEPAPEEHAAESADWSESWSRVARQAPVRLEARLHRFTLPLSRVSALSAGDVLPLDGASVAGLELIAAGGQVAARARLGRIGSMRAARIEAPAAPTMRDLHDGAAEAFPAIDSAGPDALSIEDVPLVPDIEDGALSADRAPGLDDLPALTEEVQDQAIPPDAPDFDTEASEPLTAAAPDLDLDLPAPIDFGLPPLDVPES
ncbi:MAG: hypothetical protein CSA72_13330 [Rhodobacterales bacterium]|nr:MAG: hypothetical protein CSA72_13330 [Rhodobacterales bacterium]